MRQHPPHRPVSRTARQLARAHNRARLTAPNGYLALDVASLAIRLVERPSPMEVRSGRSFLVDIHNAPLSYHDAQALLDCHFLAPSLDACTTGRPRHARTC